MGAAHPSLCPKPLERWFAERGRIEGIKHCGGDRRLYQVRLSAHEDDAGCATDRSGTNTNQICYLYRDIMEISPAFPQD